MSEATFRVFRLRYLCWSTGVPVEVGGLDVAQPVLLRRVQQDHVGRDLLVIGHLHDISNFEILPSALLELAIDEVGGLLIVCGFVVFVTLLKLTRKFT